MRILVLLSLATLASCAAKLEVHQIPQADGAEVDGVPFRMLRPHELAVFQRQADGSYLHVKTFHRVHPDMSRLYAANYSAQALADPTFGIHLSPGGALEEISLDSTAQANDVLSSAGGAATDFASAQTARATAETARQAAADAAAATLAANQAAALSAFYLAEKSIAEYNAFPPTTDPNVVQLKLLELQNLQRQANLAFGVAGMPPPYPGV